MTVAIVLPVAGPAARDRLIARWSRRLLGILRIELHAPGSPAPGEWAGSMIAANHVSWLDVVVINAVCPARFVAKAEVRDWPLIGWMTQKTGNLFIARRERGASFLAVSVLKLFLRQGYRVAFFPEATTTDGTRLKPFHPELFEAACQTRALVRPAAIRYADADGLRCAAAAFVDDMALVDSLDALFRMPELHAHLAWAPPISTAGKTRREIGEAAQEAVAALLKLPHARKSERAHARARQFALPDDVSFDSTVSSTI
jgi:1-acyl-sn-glycerol-3-phosphate acyltransferase